MVDWTKRFAAVSKRETSTFGADPAPPKPPVTGSSVARVKGIEKLDKTQLAALAATAKDLGMNVDWLAAVISFETAGSFSPSILNAAGSGAFGLIQFLPSTAANLLGLSNNEAGRAEATKRGRAMSFVEQLRKMVIPYFKGYKYNSLDDVYLKVFYPAAMNKPSDHVVATEGTKTYSQNQGFDKDHDGEITRGEITSRINSQLSAAALLPRITVTTAQWASILVGLSIVAAGAYYLSVNTNLLPIGPNANKPVGI
jgi:hypothetical protein